MRRFLNVLLRLRDTVVHARQLVCSACFVG